MEQDAVVLKVPNEMNEIRRETGVIEVYEIQENPSPSRNKCFVDLGHCFGFSHHSQDFVLMQHGK